VTDPLAHQTPLLRADVLSKRYGALVVTDDVSLEIYPGEILGLIGPNGAGKSTLIGQLSGRLQPDLGRIFLSGRDVTKVPDHQRVHAGLVQSFQVPSLFGSFTTLENVAIAVQAGGGHSYKPLNRANRNPALMDPARALVEKVGLSHRAQTLVSSLSHGERRYVELAVALAAKPKVLLLDEPLAGLSRSEAERMVLFIRDLKQDHGILLVEHDMDAVFALADRIAVLVYGRIIAMGPPDQVRNDPSVHEAYLGDDETDGLGEPAHA
jgi:branched-chain amino acid transport system ATP-binding protein